MATQKDRRETTRNLIVDSAYELFGTDGFDATTIDAIAAQAAVAKGAVYHHFANKRAIFSAVFETTAGDLVADLLTDIELSGDITAALIAATERFFTLCGEARVRRILLQDAPAVLGHAEWQRLDSEHFGGLVSAALGMAMESGAIKQRPLLPLSRVILGAMQAAALDCAAREDYAIATKEYLEVFAEILQGLK